ncbi:MAG: hypothetical protein JSR37_09705 [Verrucomicrobia bacterium]|nr:hypothetical protein [Verrucomicrobiota bacterium]MBS0637710.1 hypothetical protein [Verrucomicrobiota bacterium]
MMQAVNYVSRTLLNAVVGVPSSVVYAAKQAGTAAVGVVGSVVSVVTAGTFKGLNTIADYTQDAPHVLPTIYKAIARVVNPNFTVTQEQGRAGLLTDRIARPIIEKAKAQAESEAVTSRHVVSRALFVAGTVASVATRVADLAIGVVAAAVSIVPCFARVQAVNTLAVRQLSSLGGIVHDVCVGFRGIVNPQQFVSVKEV